MALSPYQAPRQLAWLMSQAAFLEQPMGLVFTGGAYESEDLDANWLPEQFLKDQPTFPGVDSANGLKPFARISCDGYKTSPDNPSRLEALVLRAWGTAGGGFGTVDNIGRPDSTSAAGFDTHGVNQNTGALRSGSSAYGANPSGQGLAQGRDSDELVNRFLEWLGTTPTNGTAGSAELVSSIHGMQGCVSRGEALRKVYGSQVLKREIVVEVTDATVSNYYHNPSRLTATLAAGHSVVLAWAAAPQRYDSIGYAIYRNAGLNNPQPYGTGTLIGTVAYGVNTITDSTPSGAGQSYTYVVCGIYAETPAGFAAKTIERASSGLPVNATTT